ncbi:MAG: zinc ribbon domain-containing protein [Euryarchaeota archaeon]|nr:zinc ribbon domain-containing protein [Euryarchaeota archaeon]
MAEEGWDPNKVYYQCLVCNHTFQESPDLFIVKCPQCQEEKTQRI